LSKKFSREELAKYSGKGNSKEYIAYRGKVYDVTKSSLWQDGDHLGSHEAGRDLTDELSDAPHGEDVLERFQMIGTLED